MEKVCSVFQIIFMAVLAILSVAVGFCWILYSWKELYEISKAIIEIEIEVFERKKRVILLNLFYIAFTVILFLILSLSLSFIIVAIMDGVWYFYIYAIFLLLLPILAALFLTEFYEKRKKQLWKKRYGKKE